ncbi:unnamed protein product [Camellia sinensis]
MLLIRPRRLHSQHRKTPVLKKTPQPTPENSPATTPLLKTSTAAPTPLHFHPLQIKTPMLLPTPHLCRRHPLQLQLPYISTHCSSSPTATADSPLYHLSTILLTHCHRYITHISSHKIITHCSSSSPLKLSLGEECTNENQTDLECLQHPCFRPNKASILLHQI